MPRVTRAALRSNTDSNDSPSDARAPRRVFGEVTGNTLAEAPEPTTLIELPLKSEHMPPKKNVGKPKIKKGKGERKAKKMDRPNYAAQVHPAPEVIEDDDQSTVSDAAEEACENLKNNKVLKETYQVPIPDKDRPTTPPSPAAREASRQLSPRTKKLNSKIHGSGNVDDQDKEHGQEKEDSLVEKIETLSPAKLVTTVENPTAKEDSFIRQIVSRSPVKPASRIEDSVEAIDALEDALEDVGQAIPIVEDKESPLKKRKTQPPSAAPVSGQHSSQAKKTTTTSSRKPALANTKAQRQIAVQQTRNLPASQKELSTLGKTGAKAKAQPLPNKASGATKERSPTEAPIKIPKTVYPKRKQSSSWTQPPFQPAKSTKPPTLATFELPGEAISRKLKAQREERLKKEEEEAQKKKEFKARPVRLSALPSVAVKPTIASKARESLAQDSSKENTESQSKSLSRTSSIGGGQISKRLSVLAMPKRVLSLATANTSVVHDSAPGNPKRISSAAVPCAATATKTVVTKEEVLQQKQRAREIFGRDKLEKEEREREKKEKEEAARKARAQAALRGRQASRDWAEKQRLKKALSNEGKKSEVVEGTALPAAAA